MYMYVLFCWESQPYLIILYRTANIRSRKLRGYVKGEGVQPGEELNETQTGSYAAVLLNKEWRFVDVHWGSRHVTGGSKGNWELIDDNGKGANPVNDSPAALKYQCHEYYFLPDPHEIIYSHYPKKGEEWQLLARPVTLREFQDMVYLKPAFFELGLSVVNHPRCLIKAPDGETHITIGLPKMGGCKFMYRLWMASKGKENQTNFGDFKLDRFVFMEQTVSALQCRIVFPVVGRFKFELFARRSEGDGDEGGGNYTQACSYIIDCEQAMEDCQALPENKRKEWGPGRDLERAGLKPVTHQDGM